MKTQDLRQKIIQKLGTRRSSKAIERLLRRFLPLLEQLEDRLAPAGTVLQTDIPLLVGKDYQSSAYTAALVAANHFEDISKNPAATAILTNTDNSFIEANIGFNFKFYGNSYSKIFVTSNGLLSFKSQANDSGYPDNFNTDLTGNVGPNRPLIAALWDDWLSNVSSSDQVYIATLGTPGNRRFVVQWDQLTGYANAPTTVTFEAALFESDGRIEFRYKDVIAGDGQQPYFRDNGAEATVGIRSGFSVTPPGVLYADGSGVLPTGVDGIQVAFNGGPSQQPVVEDGMTITFVPGLQAIANFPPDVAITGVPELPKEGTPINLNSFVSDPDNTGGAKATFTYDWSVTRDGAPFTTGNNTPTNGPSFSFTPPNNGSYIVTLVVVDAGGATTTVSRFIRVGNVAPVLDVGTTSTVASTNVNFTRTIHFTDPGEDSWTVDIDYGDGVKRHFTLQPGQQGYDPAAKTFQLNYAFPTDTTYKVTIRITDNDGGTDTATIPVTVFNADEFARIVAFAIGEAGEDGIGNVDLSAGKIHLAATLTGDEGDNVAVTIFNSDPTADQNQITVPGTIPVTTGSGGISNAQPLFFLDTRAVTNADSSVTQTYEFVLPDGLANNNIQLFWFNKVTDHWEIVSNDPAHGDKIEIIPILDAAGARTGKSLVRLTKTFGAGSSPATDQLTGTVFSIAVPVSGSGSTTSFLVLPSTVASTTNDVAVTVRTTGFDSGSNFALSVQETHTPLPAAGANTDSESSVDQILNWLLNGDLRRRPPGPEPELPPADAPLPALPAVQQGQQGGGGTEQQQGGGGVEQTVDSTAVTEVFASEAEAEPAVQPLVLPLANIGSDDDLVRNDVKVAPQVDPRRLHAGLVLASLLAGAGSAARPKPRNGKRYKPTLQTSGTP